MILEAAIGDAYGAMFEYVDATIIEERNNLHGYSSHPRHMIGAGRYTDDTEMSTAVIEAMLEDDFTTERLAHWFVTAFKREQRRGYARRFYDFLCTVKDGRQFIDLIDPRSNKSGAAMRGWVVGRYPDRQQVMDRARQQAVVTHNTISGVTSAQAAAMMTHFFAYRHGAHTEVAQYVASHVEGPWTEPYVGPVGPKGTDSVHAAIQMVTQNDNMADLLQRSIGLSGDVDTVATIALGAASLAIDIQQNLPRVLFDKLEDGLWGRAYLSQLDQRLDQRFPRLNDAVKTA